MSKEELEKIIFEVPIPKNWRKGQFVFNRIDELFKVARTVQFKDGIDCFYLDSQIDEFINHSLKYINHE